MNERMKSNNNKETLPRHVSQPIFNLYIFDIELSVLFFFLLVDEGKRINVYRTSRNSSLDWHIQFDNW